MTCAHRACVAPVKLHNVCHAHLVATLAAGRRAVLHAPHGRMEALRHERYAA